MNLKKEFKNAWESLSEHEVKEVMDYSNEYKKFLDYGKTERECVNYIIDEAKKYGYISLEEAIKNNKIESGAKIYANNKDKSVALFLVGNKELQEGMRVVGGHIDSPRIDLKPVPVYEDSDQALLKTHYYGGIKKYQWTALPLSMHGVLYKKNGEKVEICIGEKDEDPIFYISDLLIHLSKDQMAKKLSEGITGEGLNLLIGNMPIKGEEYKDEKEKVKLNVLKILNDMYGIEEEDFVSAEIEIVPASKARDVGFDRSMISAYGHDDRVCSFAGLKAILENESSEYTQVGLFMDKEEVGSMGNTGMQSRFFENCVAELINLEGDYNDLKLRRSLANSKVLSADVTAIMDPNYPDVVDKRNCAYLSKGIVLTKYTGSRGKGGCNDANAEFVSHVKNVFNENNIVWQTGELGKVDQGGGGTIAYILANYGAEVIDCGVGVMSMHAPVELVSKVDCFMAYRGYKAFLNN